MTTALEQLERDIRQARAAAFREGARAAEDAIINWPGNSKADPERKLQTIFASIARSVRNPYEFGAAVPES